MLGRCTNKNDPAYHRYGGRGIAVCERWFGFGNFVDDMGERPAGTSLDRIENDKGYYLENCRWAAPEIQHLNKRSIHWVTLNGETMCLTDWARRYGVDPGAIRYRMRVNGWDYEQAITTPFNKGSTNAFKSGLR
jgi:hypothetical protein